MIKIDTHQYNQITGFLLNEIDEGSDNAAKLLEEIKEKYEKQVEKLKKDFTKVNDDLPFEIMAVQGE